MHPALIQAEIKKAGYTQKQIAKELKVSEFHISEVINHPRYRPSDRVMKHIAKIIKKHHHDVFPDYYFRKNKRKKKAA